MTPTQIKVLKLKACATLFPDPRLVHFGAKNPSYFNSLFVGLTAPLINLPVLIWNCILKHTLFGLYAVVMFILTSVVMGIRGRAHGVALVSEVNGDAE